MDQRNAVEAAVGGAVRRLREGHHLSLRTLGERTGFSASFLSQVEHGQVSPSIASLGRIASALGVTLAEFFAATADDAATAVTRAGHRPAVDSGWSRARLEVLTAHRRPTGVSCVLVTLGPGGRSGRETQPADNEEFAFVLEGETVLTLGAERHTLAAGDAATIPHGTPRRWENLGDGTVCIVVVEALSGASAARPPSAVPAPRQPQP